jgi:hypothetical protein
MAIPRDLLDEIQLELASSCRILSREVDRLKGLFELERLALSSSIRLGRPVTVADVLRQADDEHRERLVALVRSLRRAVDAEAMW